MLNLFLYAHICKVLAKYGIIYNRLNTNYKKHDDDITTRKMS